MSWKTLVQLISCRNASPSIPSTSHSGEKFTSEIVDPVLCHSSNDSLEIEVAKYSFARLFFIHTGAALTLFLATTDSTILSTSLPTITADLNASSAQYTWIGVSYMLTQTACQPLYGRLSDLVGRKTVLYTSIVLFALGSLLCGAAKSVVWLITARGLAGIGGGGIVSLVWTITSEVVETRHRAQWSQALSVTWSCSAIAGPLLGGLFSSRISWRWGFYINLPICLVASIVFLISLHNVPLHRQQSISWGKFAQKFDFVGLALFMSGTSCIVLGFSLATNLGWTSVPTLTLMISGLVVLAIGSHHEIRTKREALFPPAAFQNRDILITLAVTFLHNMAFNAGTFYLSLYFQAVDSLSALGAGIQLLPYSLGSSLASMPAAWFMTLWQERTKNTSGQKWTICAGLSLATMGFGLMTLLHPDEPRLLRSIFPLVSGSGLGMLFHAPYQIFTAALKPSELATGTSAFFLVRFSGATIGLAVAGAIFNRELSCNVPAGYQIQNSTSSINWQALSLIEPPTLRVEVQAAVSSSIKTIWIVCAPCLGFALLLAVFIRRLPIGVTTKYNPDRENDSIGSSVSSEPLTVYSPSR